MAVLELLTWQELEIRICGDPEITVEALKKTSKRYRSMQFIVLFCNLLHQIHTSLRIGATYCFCFFFNLVWMFFLVDWDVKVNTPHCMHIYSSLSLSHSLSSFNYLLLSVQSIHYASLFIYLSLSHSSIYLFLFFFFLSFLSILHLYSSLSILSSIYLFQFIHPL